MSSTPLPRTRVADRLGVVALAAVVVGWIGVLGSILRHRIFVSHDTVISYAHVWFISDRIWQGHRLPFRMPVVAAGKGLAFPYGLVPWLLASIARPVAGDWTVTATLVLGGVLLAAATYAAFPELRRGWFAASVLLNPALIDGVLIGQMPFLWASALLLAAVACWRRQRWWWATALAALSQVTHPAVLMPLTAALVGLALLWEPDRRRLLRHYAVSAAIALPAAWLVIASPVFVESSLWVKAANFVTTLAPRSSVIITPLVLLMISRRWRGWAAGPIALLLLVLLNAGMWGPIGLPSSWQALSHGHDERMVPFLSSPGFHAGATYRLLRIDDAKIGMYQLLRAGGRLDSEFFPESMRREAFADQAAYTRFLRARDVDFVMVWNGYRVAFSSNEPMLLDVMSKHPPDDCSGANVCVRFIERTKTFALYEITRS